MNISELSNKFHRLEDAVRGEIFERHEEIHTGVLALVSRKHHFQVGPPGTAKSLLVERIAKRIGGMTDQDYFRWLLTQYTTPDELFGGPDFGLLREHGIFKRVTEHKLPRARIAFLDEVFKGSSAILNTNLTIMNERIFNNVDDDPNVPLISVFSASNEIPQGDELLALWDRLQFRHRIANLRESSSFVGMLQGSMVDDPEPAVTLEDLAAAATIAANVAVGDDIFEALRDLREGLRKTGVEPSERRWVDCIDVIKAEAFFNGREVADTEDVRPLMHVLWTRVDDIREVRKHVLELANPIDREVAGLLDGIHELETQFHSSETNDNYAERGRVAQEILGKLKKVVVGSSKERGVAELRKILDESGKTSYFIEELESRATTLSLRLKEELELVGGNG